jgi:hypothetical protein
MWGLEKPRLRVHDLDPQLEYDTSGLLHKALDYNTSMLVHNDHLSR